MRTIASIGLWPRDSSSSPISRVFRFGVPAFRPPVFGVPGFRPPGIPSLLLYRAKGTPFYSGNRAAGTRPGTLPLGPPLSVEARGGYRLHFRAVADRVSAHSALAAVAF